MINGLCERWTDGFRGSHERRSSFNCAGIESILLPSIQSDEASVAHLSHYRVFRLLQVFERVSQGKFEPLFFCISRIRSGQAPQEMMENIEILQFDIVTMERLSKSLGLVIVLTSMKKTVNRNELSEFLQRQYADREGRGSESAID